MSSLCRPQHIVCIESKLILLRMSMCPKSCGNRSQIVIKKVIGVTYKNKIRHRLVASVFQCGKNRRIGIRHACISVTGWV